MDADTVSTTPARAPRSRKDRPCDYCRRLKHRCVITRRGEQCSNCQKTKRECTFTTTARSNRDRHASASSVSLREKNVEAAASTNNVLLTVTEPAALELCMNREIDREGSNDVYYPSLDMELEDAQESQYLGSAAFSNLSPSNQASSPSLNTAAAVSGGIAYRQVSDPNQPVFFLRSSSKVYGLANGAYSADKAWQAVVSTLKAEKEDSPTRLFQLFIDRTLPALPLVNRSRLEAACAGNHTAGPFPWAVMVGVLTHALVLVPAMRHLAKQLWGIALSLLDNEYRQPRLSTLQLALLDIYGWPILNPGGNHVAISRAVGAAQLLGLHRDCSHWKLPSWEKATRQRIWWCLYIADKWNALQYGRPSNMPKTIYVRIPSHGYTHQVDGQSSSSFIDMCQLTVIVDTLLPLLDDMQRTEEITLGQHRSILINATKDIESVCSRPSIDSASKPPGQRSLQLCQLGTIVLINTLTLDFRLQHHSHRDKTVPALSVDALSTIDSVCLFVETIDPPSAGDYWAPWSSLNVTRTVALLIRLALIDHQLKWPDEIGCEQPSVRQALAALERLVVALIRAERNSWHVAEDALRVIKGQLSSVSDLPGIDTVIALLRPPIDVFSGDPSAGFLQRPASSSHQSASHESSLFWDPNSGISLDPSSDDLAALFSLGLQSEWMTSGPSDPFASI